MPTENENKILLQQYVTTHNPRLSLQDMIKNVFDLELDSSLSNPDDITLAQLAEQLPDTSFLKTLIDEQDDDLKNTSLQDLTDTNEKEQQLRVLLKTAFKNDLQSRLNSGDLTIDAMQEYYLASDLADNEELCPAQVAIANGEKDLVEVMFNRGMTIDGCFSDYNPLSQAAYSSSNWQTFQYIWDQANPDEKKNMLTTPDDNGNTPLHIAAIAQREDIFQGIVANWDDFKDYIHDNPMKQPNAKGEHIVHLAVCHFSNEGLDDLKTISEGYQTVFGQSLFKARNKHNDNYSALHYAAVAGNYSALQHLILHHGLDVNVANNNNITPLHICAKQGDKDIIDFLLNNDGNPNKTNDIGLTPLHLSAQSGNPEAIDTILLHDKWFTQININTQDDFGLTPLHHAILKKNWDNVNYLIDNGARTDITSYKTSELPIPINDDNTLDLRGFTPAHLLALFDDGSIIDKVNEKSAEKWLHTNDFNHTDSLYGRNIFHYAALNKEHGDQIVKKLHDKFKHTWFKDYLFRSDSFFYGDTPLQYAARMGNDAAVSTILKIMRQQNYKAKTFQSAILTPTKQEGLNALELAAKSCDAATVKALLEISQPQQNARTIYTSLLQAADKKELNTITQLSKKVTKEGLQNQINAWFNEVNDQLHPKWLTFKENRIDKARHAADNLAKLYYVQALNQQSNEPLEHLMTLKEQLINHSEDDDFYHQQAEQCQTYHYKAFEGLLHHYVKHKQDNLILSLLQNHFMQDDDYDYSEAISHLCEHAYDPDQKNKLSPEVLDNLLDNDNCPEAVQEIIQTKKQEGEHKQAEKSMEADSDSASCSSEQQHGFDIPQFKSQLIDLANDQADPNRPITIKQIKFNNDSDWQDFDQETIDQAFKSQPIKTMTYKVANKNAHSTGESEITHHLPQKTNQYRHQFHSKAQTDHVRHMVQVSSEQGLSNLYIAGISDKNINEDELASMAKLYHFEEPPKSMTYQEVAYLEMNQLGLTIADEDALTISESVQKKGQKLLDQDNTDDPKNDSDEEKTTGARLH